MVIHDLFAYLHVKGAAKAIEFYTTVLGAKEKFRLAGPEGRIRHAELDFGGTTLMLADEFPEFGIQGPTGEYGGPQASKSSTTAPATSVSRKSRPWLR